MNLIKRTTLHYQGDSDNNCEINLWEVEEEKYEVILIQKVLKGYYYKLDTKTKEKEEVIKLGESLLTRYLQNIQQKAKDNPDLGIQTAKDFIHLLLTPEKRQGSYSYIVSQLQECLNGWINSIDKQTLIKLFKSETSSVQELAGVILQENSDNFSHQLTTKEIVELANHDILSIRQAALRNVFTQHSIRLTSNGYS